MPPRRRAHLSRTHYASDASVAKTSGVGAAAELLATRGPHRSLRIEWLWHNAPSLAAGQAPWYRLVLFGEEDYDRQGFPPDGYRLVVGGFVVGDDEDASTDTD